MTTTCSGSRPLVAALHKTGFLRIKKFWRTKFLEAYKKHLPFKSLDSLSGIRPSFPAHLKHATVDAYYDAMLPTRDQFQNHTADPAITGHMTATSGRAHVLSRSHGERLHRSPAKHFLVIGPWDPCRHTHADPMKSLA